MNEVKENANSDIVLVLVGAKKDLEDRRMISYESAKKFMIQNKCALFFETSAKTGENIDEVYFNLHNNIRSFFNKLKFS